MTDHEEHDATGADEQQDVNHEWPPSPEAALSHVPELRQLINELVRSHGAATFGPFLNGLYVIEAALEAAKDKRTPAEPSPKP